MPPPCGVWGKEMRLKEEGHSCQLQRGGRDRGPGRYAPALLFALIHRSAWNRISANFRECPRGEVRFPFVTNVSKYAI